LPVKNGDFILLNYTVRVKESGEIIDTTIESVAKEADLHREHREGEKYRYEPSFLVVGEGWMTKGLDEGLIGLETGKTSLIEAPPEKAYGVRDPSKLKLLPLRRFKSEGIEPLPGMQVNLDGKLAQIRSVGAGRVQVDYNHPLAGKTLLYEVTVEKIIEDPEEKVRNLLHRRVPNIDPSKFTVKLSAEEVIVEIPEEAFYLEDLQIAKRSLAADIERFFPEKKRTVFIETFEMAKPIAVEKPVAPAVEAGAPNRTERVSTEAQR
jgi:FKBP-type peptidyl-prolyl cis-trans isomerase 2